MTTPQLIILGYSEAAMLMRQSTAETVTAILSIHGQREHGVESSVSHRLDLIFDDIEVPNESDPVEHWQTDRRRRWRAEQGLIESPPTPADAAAIIEFAESIAPLSGTLLCHCQGGMSRAPAAALICLSVWHGGGTEAACAAKARLLRPGAVPHVGLVRFADDLLGRRGELLRAISALAKS